jgi:hypothetical protein
MHLSVKCPDDNSTADRLHRQDKPPSPGGDASMRNKRQVDGDVAVPSRNGCGEDWSRMTPKSGFRFSEKIMRKQKDKRESDAA